MNKNQDYFFYLKKTTVLYVEDDDSTREELEYFLEKKVYKLIVAKNGQEGLELYNKHNPDLIVTDIQMPVMNGIKMIKSLKEINPNLPIVIITAFNDTDYLFEAIKLNVTGYLTKPLNLYALSETLFTISKNIFLDKENKEIYNTLKQYKDIVDERAIISKMTIDGTITYVNEPFEIISGYKKEELLGESHYIINPLINNKILKDIFKRIKIEKKSWHGHIKNISKEGKEYFLDLIIKPILDLDGNILEFISLANDITDLEISKNYFELLTQKNTLDLNESIRVVNAYKEAIDESNIILRIDLNKNIVYANKAFYDCTDYKKDELLGKPYSSLKHFGLDEKEQEEKINNMFCGEIWKGKISIYGKNEKIFHFDVTLFPLKNSDGKVNEYMEIIHDITEIENLHDELEDTQREIIYKLGEIGETRSSETGNHVKRVAEYSKLLAQKINLNYEDTNRLFIASPMHDIGKIGIPDSILNKPGKLTPEEWEIMKNHAQIGYDILRNSKREILKAAGIVSYTHHEKWDGSGYPLGLKGEEIHIFGRITAIVDVFDALSSERVYKKAWDIEKILELLKEEKGKHFDPNLVDVFIENLNEFLEIKDKYKEVDEKSEY